MLKRCGQIVNILRVTLRKTRVRLSTKRSLFNYQVLGKRAKQTLIHKVSPQFSQLISPLKFASLPLAEHYLYPVSTAPINNCNQRKLKKGNK